MKHVEYSTGKIKIDHGNVHIWLASIEEEAGSLEYLLKILPADEEKRAERYVFEKDRKRYIIAHGILRLILARYIPIEPENILLTVKKRGKPVLNQPEYGNISFNISHSNNYIVFALALGMEIGIDIEYMKDLPNSDEIVKRFFSMKEIKEYFELTAGVRKRAFFTCWTRKESFIKATGEGFYYPLDSFSVSPDPDIKSNTVIQCGTGGEQKWSLLDIDIEDRDYVCTVAVEGEYSRESIRDIFYL